MSKTLGRLGLWDFDFYCSPYAENFNSLEFYNLALYLSNTTDEISLSKKNGRRVFALRPVTITLFSF
jgi:hypothetical protein